MCHREHRGQNPPLRCPLNGCQGEPKVEENNGNAEAGDVISTMVNIAAPGTYPVQGDCYRNRNGRETTTAPPNEIDALPGRLRVHPGLERLALAGENEEGE